MLGILIWPVTSIMHQPNPDKVTNQNNVHPHEEDEQHAI